MTRFPVSPLLAAFALLVASQSQAVAPSSTADAAYGSPLRTGGFVDPAVVESGVASDIPAGGLPAPLVAVQGWATYYPTCSRCAAAGPAIARMFGGGRRYLGQWVIVNGDTEHPLRLVTSCACGDRTFHGITDQTVIDLNPVAFARIARLGTGVVHVVVEPYSPALPQTDTASEPRAWWWGVAL